ncbi:MAG: LicD family protein [Bacteroidales bacterium]|nr:LicD family protein [Bacteroidales bacterium]
MEDFSKYNGEGTMLRKAQLRMLDILIAVDKICRKHNIPYWLDYGTLLGAVRHGGFIPWDDDLDISMMKEDYDRFLTIASKELPEQFVVQNIHTEKYFPYAITRIVDLNSEVARCGPMDYSHGKRKHKGLWIDVFQVVKGDVRLSRWLEPLYGRCFRRVHHFEPFNISVLIAYILFPVVWLAKQLMDFLGGLYSGDLRTIEMAVDEHRDQKHYGDYLPTSEILFEGIMFYAPNHTERVLTNYYGDYMQIPSENNRVSHMATIKFLDSNN